MRGSDRIGQGLAGQGRVVSRAASVLPVLALGAGVMIGMPGWAATASAVQAMVPPAADLKMRSLAATCAACHGTDGRSTADDAVPGLAGRPAEELVQLLQAFKAGDRPGTVMPQLAKGYDDAQIDLLARYFAAQSAAPLSRPPAKRPAARAATRPATQRGTP